MGIVVVGRVGQATAITSATTLAVTVPGGGVPAGHWLIVGFVSNTTSSDGVVTCGDSKGNTYALDEEDIGALRRTSGFSTHITTALVAGDTITVTVPVAASRRTMDVLHVSGLQGKDVSAHNNGASTAPSVGPTATRSHTNALAVGICGWTDNSASGDVFTARADFAGTETTVEAFSASLGRYLATEYKIAGAPVGTNSAAGTLPTSQNWSMLVIAYGEEDLLTWVSGDRVKETTTTTGTGDITLAGAASGFQAFSAIAGDQDLVAYAIVHQTLTEWETGVGRWTTGAVLQRVRVLQSSNSGAAVSFSAGSKDVFCTFPGQHGNFPMATRQPQVDVLIPDGGSAYIASGLDIASGKVFEIGASAVLEIG